MLTTHFLGAWSRNLPRTACHVASFSAFNLPRQSFVPSFQRINRTNHTNRPRLDYAFAFDIDGVLMLGHNAIPAGSRALKRLEEKKIPYILLTNGGGKGEADRVTELSGRLGVNISVNQLIQSHTPYRHLVHRYENIVIFSKDEVMCRSVAERYGFRNVWTATDVNANFPDLWPFRTDHPEEFKFLSPHTQIDAALVFDDPADWGRDIQIIVDLVLSPDRNFGSKMRLERQARDGTGVAVILSANDLIWSNPFPWPRWGQGAFRIALEALYTSLTDDPEPMNITQFGKPSAATFNYAENVLTEYLERWHGVRQISAHGKRVAPRRVYMIGDNPDSDIRGANDFGWYSVLVRTGNFKGKGNSPIYPAREVFDNVELAVDWIIKQEDRRLQNLVAAGKAGEVVEEDDDRYYAEYEKN